MLYITQPSSGNDWTIRAHSSVKNCVVTFHIIAASTGNCMPGGGKWNRVQKESLLLEVLYSGSSGKELPANTGDTRDVGSLGQEEPLE